MASPYTTERLLEILRDLAAELGRAPTVRELLARPGCPSHTSVITRFGSWNAALEAAGLEPRHHCALACTDEQLLTALRTLAAELGRSPSAPELLARRDLPSPGACQQHFGIWTAALEAAGLKPRHHYTPTYTDEHMLEILRNLATELGRSPTVHDLRARRDLPSHSTYHDHFGCWNAALTAAGLKLNRTRKATDRQIARLGL